MSPTPLDGVPWTSQDVDDLTTRSIANATAIRAATFDPDAPVIYTAGSFVPTTTGTFPDSYVHGGPAFDAASTERAVMVLFAPASWSTVNVGILGLAASFGSGNVRLRLGAADVENDVTIAVAGAFVGDLDFPTPLSWSAASGPFAGVQFVQFPLNRLGGDGADTLAEDFGVLAVVLTNGA